jgi:outer membrane receptor protein involved in Fe transport
MMRSRRFILLLLLVIPVMQARPDGVIKGRIFDKSSGEGLPEATVVLRKTQGTHSDGEGFYMLKSKPGNLTLSFRYLGYKTVTEALQLNDNDTLILNVGLEAEASEIDQVVVSAGRKEQRISELSVSMSVIKPSVLNNLHVSDPQELINKTPGIEVLDGQASVRGGSGFSYGAGSRVLALLDGLPVMSADAGNIRWGFLPLENISQIEIIKGASSVAYGSSALNGVINFRTADPGDIPETRYYAEAGVFDAPANRDWKWWKSPRSFYNASVSHLQKVRNTSLGLGLNLLDDQGYRKLNNDKSGRFNLKIKHLPENGKGLSYGLSFNGGTTVKTDFVLWENALTGALKNNPSASIELHSHFFTIDPFLQFSGNSTKHEFKARLQSSHNKFPESAKNNSDASNFYSEYLFSRNISPVISMIAGISENYSWIQSNFYGNHNELNVGAFLQSDFVVSEKIRFTSGVRMEDNWLDGKADKLVPLFRAGLNFRAVDYTFIRASFGQGYRFPSIAEKYASTTIGTIKIFPSPYVQSEKGWNAEIGVKQGIGSRFFTGLADLSFFYSRHYDMIEYLFGIYPDPGATTYSFGFKANNLEAASVYGAELEYSLSAKTGQLSHTFSGGYTYMYPVEINAQTGKSTGSMLKYRRHHAASLTIRSEYGRFFSDLGMYIKSKILRIDDVFLDQTTREGLLPGFYDYWNTHNKGFIMLDASAGCSLGKHLSLSLMVKNLTNTEYMGRPGDIQPQRNFSLRLNGEF